MKFRTVLLTFFFFCISCALCAQPQIRGAACVVPTTDYDYFISGSPDSIAQISVCITGGVFVNTQNTCKTITPHTTVRVNWNDSATNARITISYSGQQKVKVVQVTKPLNAGEIANARKRQQIKYDSAAAPIPCSPATKGSCSPAYLYQWQQSANALSWTNIPGANGQHLPSQGALREPVFYRRKVTETVSGTIAYSTIATVFVDAQ